MTGYAVIPARGGSKRIPRKNIRSFDGRPIIAYPIAAALDSGAFEEVFVSTDDEEIARIAIDCGAKVPFLRSAEASDDHAPLADVLLEFVNRSEPEYGQPDFIACILPTTPLLTGALLRKAFEQYRSCMSGHGLMAVERFSYPILRSLRIENDEVKLKWPEYELTRSQDLEEAFHDAGMFYFLDCARFLEQKRIFMERMAYFEVSPFVSQDIDTEEDWQMALLKYRMTNGIADDLH